MDRPVHLDASTSADFAYATRNSLRRNPPMLFVGENTTPEDIERARKAGAILVDARREALDEVVEEVLKGASRSPRQEKKDN